MELSKDSVADSIKEIVGNLTADWDLDLDGELDGTSKLVENLGFSSVDFVELAVAIEERFDNPDVGFDELIVANGRRVDDLSIQQISDFIFARLQER